MIVDTKLFCSFFIDELYQNKIIYTEKKQVHILFVSIPITTEEIHKDFYA